MTAETETRKKSGRKVPGQTDQCRCGLPIVYLGPEKGWAHQASLGAVLRTHGVDRAEWGTGPA